LRPDARLNCADFPCRDVKHACYIIPSAELDAEKMTTVMVSEAPPEDADEYFYAKNSPFYLETTLQAFNDSGFNVSSMRNIMDLGVYITTAVKCSKRAYSVSPETVENCSRRILERELELFPKAKNLLLMGDTAIRAVNSIAKRQTGKAIIPSGPTYKIRKRRYFYKGLRVLPAYLQTGKSYLIEKSKRKMIAEDIKAALGL